MTQTLFKKTDAIMAHIRALKTRKAYLDGKIGQEHSRPAPDQQKLRWLKTRRLLIKDQLAHYDSHLRRLKPLAGHVAARARGMA